MTTSLAADWKTDGSDDPSLGDKQMTYTKESLGDDGTDCLDVKTTMTRPSNFLYELGSPASRFFFDVKLVEIARGSSLSVGVTKSSNLKMGFGTKGMYYNGNLTNGMGALKTSFGPRPQQGDSIVLEYVQSEEFIEVTYYVNGQCIGTGFRVPKEDEVFHPVLSITGQAKVQTKLTEDVPAYISEGGGGPSILRTTFKLTEAKDASGTTFIPVEGGSGQNLKVAVNPAREDRLALSAVVCNTLSIHKNFAVTEGGITLASIEGGPGVSSTRRRAPPPYDAVERIVKQCMEAEWVSMTLSVDGKELSILNGDGECVAKGEKDVQPSLTSY